MKIRTPYTTFMIISALLAIFFVAVWFVIVYKSYSLKSDIATISETAENTTAKNAYLLSLKNVLRDSKSDLEIIDKRFLTKDGIPGFIDLLELKATSTAVKVDLGSINLDESAGPTGIQTLKIRISGSGTWKNVLIFVSLLESLPYAITMNGLDMSRGPVKSGEWSFSTDIAVAVVDSKINTK